MNIIAGWMMPGDELGPEAGRVQRLVVLLEGLARPRCCRPKTFTSECPVYISSMWPLSLPVVAHCWMNCGCARLPISRRDQHRHRHGDQRDERQQRRDPEHHGQHADDGQQRGDELAQRLLQRLRDVVGVVGGPAEHLAARLLVEVAQRQPGQLRLDLLAQPVDAPAARRRWSAGPGAAPKHRRDRGRCASTQQQHRAERGRSRCPGRARRPSRRACRRACRWPLGAQPRDRLLLGDARPAAAGR